MPHMCMTHRHGDATFLYSMLSLSVSGDGSILSCP